VERLKSSGSLSHELFEKIMKRFIRARNKKGFLATLELMDSLGVPSTVSTYRYIILGASLSQRTDSVLQVWQRLIDEGEVPDSALWTALFEALGRTLAYDKIVDMFTVRHTQLLYQYFASDYPNKDNSYIPLYPCLEGPPQHKLPIRPQCYSSCHVPASLARQ
jgi:hypothetical protein